MPQNIQGWVRESECEQLVREGFLEEVATQQRQERWEGHTRHVSTWTRASGQREPSPRPAFMLWQNKRIIRNTGCVSLQFLEHSKLFYAFAHSSLHSCCSLLFLHSPEWLLIFQAPIQTLILQRNLPWLSNLRHHLLATFSDNTYFYLYKVQLFAYCISQTSRETEPRAERERESTISIAITIYLCLYLCIYICIDLSQELAQMIMGVEKPHVLLSASCRTRKGRGIIQSESKAWELGWGANGVSPNPRLEARKPELIS